MKRIALSLVALAALAVVGAVPAAASGGIHVHPHIGFYWGPSWGHPWGWGGAYGWNDPRWGYTAVYPAPGYRYGALDLDVSPERAEVWIDGRKVGVADDFDGFPDYLWLDKGTYDVVFYAPGYKTLARQYSIYPGLVIDVEDDLEPGEAVPPQQLATKSHERRDERLRRDRESEEELSRGARRDRPEAERAEPAPLDARGEPGRLRLDVTPEDASVYLDGRFLGTGRELARLRAGLIVDPGEHSLQVVRPGREEQSRTFQVEAGREVELEIALSED